MVTGSARNVGDTQPPKVARAQKPKNSTKKAMPRNQRWPAETGRSGTNSGLCLTRLAAGSGAGSLAAKAAISLSTDIACPFIG
ncbi:hypothetical protein ABK905_15015 [Acerihabitans sp. KWT182]|uniref:Uncharacterized protein n=1 Tax=Acerihabitans sp. KWT182 TaxID=3157919 RepID=A0AAU7QFT9_9GAMM